jgi:hypothetical protein
MTKMSALAGTVARDAPFHSARGRGTSARGSAAYAPLMDAAPDALEIDAAQNDFRALALETSLQKFLRDAVLDPAAQFQELGLALRRCRLEWLVEIIQGAGADGATNLGLPIHHREEYDHPVEIVFLKCTLCERHVALLPFI